MNRNEMVRAIYSSLANEIVARTFQELADQACVSLHTPAAELRFSTAVETVLTELHKRSK